MYQFSSMKTCFKNYMGNIFLTKNFSSNQNIEKTPPKMNHMLRHDTFSPPKYQYIIKLFFKSKKIFQRQFLKAFIWFINTENEVRFLRKLLILPKFINFISKFMQQCIRPPDIQCDVMHKGLYLKPKNPSFLPK